MTTTLQGTWRSAILRPCAAVALVAVFLVGVLYSSPQPTAGTVALPKGGGDVGLYSSIVASLQAGTSYYVAVGSELRARGYPTVPVMNWRTPLHLSSVAALTIPGAGVFFALLGLAVLVAGVWALAPRGADATAWGLICVAGAVVPLVLAHSRLVLFGEAWCGFCVGLSLAAYARQRWVAAAAFGVAAVFLRELAAPYVLVCGLVALFARRRHESLVWIFGGIAYLTYYAIHAWFAQAAIQPGDLRHLESWVRWQGLGFVFSTAKWYAWTLIAPRLLTPLVVAAGLAAAMAPSAPVQLRLGIIAYVVAFSIIGQPFDSYWGLVTAPLWAFGLAFSADGVRWIAGIHDVPARCTGRVSLAA